MIVVGEHEYFLIYSGGDDFLRNVIHALFILVEIGSVAFH